jgi:phosphocarrier protein
MIEQSVDIINRLGLHARAAAKLVDCAARFSCKITLQKDGKGVDAKSIMAVMMLAAGQGSRLLILLDGQDEEEARAALLALINDRFGEPD